MAVLLKADAQEQLDSLPVVPHRRVMNLLARLEDWPDVSGAKPLRGALAGRFRLRTGDYRVQFVPRGADVIVEKIGNRRDFYEQ
jgi:mRNA-degrading endonuclease RelE of RelBE toxin-antitoxin system